MIKVSKPTKEQLAINAKRMKAMAAKLKEAINLTNHHEQAN
jgi:hypothetical protein